METLLPMLLIVMMVVLEEELLVVVAVVHLQMVLIGEKVVVDLLAEWL